MTDQVSDTRGGPGEPPFGRPPRGRHAGPRTSALTRLYLPFGKALALTALPTALVLGSHRVPGPADASTTTALSVAAEESGGSGADGVDCARTDGSSAPAAGPSVSLTPSADPHPSGAAGGRPSGNPGTTPERADDEEAGRTPSPTATATAPGTATGTPTPGATSGATGLVGLLGSLLGGDAGQPSPSPDPSLPTEASPSPSPASPTPTATRPSGPRPPVTPVAPAPSHGGAGGAGGAEPSPRPTSPEPSAGADRTCDISDVQAPQDTSVARFGAEPWKLKGSQLELHDVVFHGVVTVDTAAGPRRVLKFTAAAVKIRDLRMAVPVGPQIQHIDGAPGSTSTIQGDDITMYVESLTGTLSGVENLPAPPVLRLHLTPDSVPEWLYDTIGNLGLKLQLRLDDADIDQAGQTGGELVIPGIHGYGTPR